MTIARVQKQKITRRTQEDRRAETSRKLIEATIDAIVSDGYAAIRTGHITKRADVSWGAVQHLFGDKEGLLLEVANHASQNLISQIRARINPTSDMEERVDLVIRLTWRAYRSASYIAMVDILRGSKSDQEFNEKVIATQRAWIDELGALWREVFDPLGVDTDRIDKARTAATLMLSGLASRRIFLHLEERVNDTLDITNDMVTLIMRGEI